MFRCACCSWSAAHHWVKLNCVTSRYHKNRLPRNKKVWLFLSDYFQSCKEIQTYEDFIAFCKFVTCAEIIIHCSHMQPPRITPVWYCAPWIFSTSTIQYMKRNVTPALSERLQKFRSWFAVESIIYSLTLFKWRWGTLLLQQVARRSANTYLTSCLHQSWAKAPQNSCGKWIWCAV